MSTGRKLLLALVLSVFALCSTLLAGSAGLLDPISNLSWDLRQRLLARDGNDRIKLVLVDQASLDWGKNEHAWAWPWPREVYVAVLEYLEHAGAKVVAFDVLFSEPSMYGVADDEALSSALASTDRFVGAVLPSTKVGDQSRWPEGLPANGFTLQDEHGLTRRRRESLAQARAVFWTPELVEHVRYLGHVAGSVDEDSVTRRVFPVEIFDDQALPMLGIGAYALGEAERTAAGMLQPPPIVIEPRRLVIGDLQLPLDSDGRAILRFRREQDRHGRRSYEAVNAAAVIESALLLREGAQPRLAPGVFKDAYVFLGFSAPGLYDLKATPFNPFAPGVLVHATVLDNLLNGDGIAEAPSSALLLFLFVMTGMASVAGLFSRSGLTIVLCAALFLLSPLLAGFAAFHFGYSWPIIEPQAGVLVALFSGLIINYSTEGRERRFIKNAFEHYLSPVVIERILEDPSRLELGGDRRELSMFFSDLEGFTSLSEKLDPQTLTQLLNDYLTDMSEILLAEGGTLDKYEGDAIIAFWNAPLDQQDHALRACRAALRCQEKLRARRAEFEQRSGKAIRMRIGVNTGTVVVGNMGSRDRFDYTMIGDAANLAARLEGANKHFGSYLLVSEFTWNAARQRSDEIVSRPLGRLRVVGRSTPVGVFELLGFRGAVDLTIVSRSAEVVDLVERRQWRDAQRCCTSLPEDDPVAALYRSKLAAVIEQGEEWDGVWTLSSK